MAITTLPPCTHGRLEPLAGIDSSGRLLLSGFLDDLVHTDNRLPAERYDPATGLWTLFSSLPPFAGFQVNCTVDNFDRLIQTGSAEPAGPVDPVTGATFSTDTAVFDPATDSWWALGASPMMAYADLVYSTVFANNLCYIFRDHDGGTTFTPPSSFGANQFASTITSAPSSSWSVHSQTTFGWPGISPSGYSDNSDNTSSTSLPVTQDGLFLFATPPDLGVAKYDPATDSYSLGSAYPTSVSYIGKPIWDGTSKLFYIGIDYSVVYDHSTDAWSTFPGLSTTIAGVTASDTFSQGYADDQLVALLGYKGSQDIYVCPMTGAWAVSTDVLAQPGPTAVKDSLQAGVYLLYSDSTTVQYWTPQAARARARSYVAVIG